MKKLLLVISIGAGLMGCDHSNSEKANDPLTVVDTNYGKISIDSVAREVERKKHLKDQLEPGLSAEEIAKEQNDKSATDSTFDATMRTKPHIYTRHSENDKLVDSIKMEAEKLRKNKQ